MRELKLNAKSTYSDGVEMHKSNALQSQHIQFRYQSARRRWQNKTQIKQNKTKQC